MRRDEVVALRPAILQELIGDNGGDDVRPDVVISRAAVPIAEVPAHRSCEHPYTMQRDLVVRSSSLWVCCDAPGHLAGLRAAGLQWAAKHVPRTV